MIRKIRSTLAWCLAMYLHLDRDVLRFMIVKTKEALSPRQQSNR